MTTGGAWRHVATTRTLPAFPTRRMTTKAPLPFDVDELPEAHRIVIQLLVRLDRGRGVTWETLRREAAALGIGEEELRIVLHGTSDPESETPRKP